jgi:hypothetical protein
MATRKAKNIDYVIAIPSYKRAETLRDKSLRVLAEYGIETRRIYIFVANKEEEKLYKETLDPKLYNKIVVGVPKIGPQRAFISNYFPVGKPLVQMDDDVSGFIEWSAGAKRNETKLKDLKSVIRRGFEECKKANCGLWGIYPIANGFFMKKGATTDLRFIIGIFHGCFNPGTKGPKGIKHTIEIHKEDYERTILFYLRDGAVVRLSDVAPKTAYYTEKGGNEEFRKTNHMATGAKMLAEKYPDLVSMNTSRKSGYPEIRLRDKTRKTTKQT